MDPVLESVSDPGCSTGRGSRVKTCCVNASKAKDRMVNKAPKEAKYLSTMSIH